MATEYLQFAGALVFFLAILIGSYWFVYVPQSRGSDEEGASSDRSVTGS